MGAAALMMASVAAPASGVTPAPSVLADGALTACARATLALPPTEPVTADQVATLTSLTCTTYGTIRSLSGLEHATSLETLDLHDAIGAATGYDTWTDTQAATLLMLEPLRSLPHLDAIDVSGTPGPYRYDLAVLETLPSLRSLRLGWLHNEDIVQVGQLSGLVSFSGDYGDEVTDISGLAGMANLADLEIPRLLAADLGPLADLPALQSLSLWAARAEDLPSLGGLTNLADVNLAQSNITSIAGLAGTALVHLDISSTRVHDLLGLDDVSRLEALNVTYAQVGDLDELVGADHLKTLNADGATLTSLQPLSGLASLETLTIESNSIVDLGPLANVPSLKHLEAWNNRIDSVAPLANLASLEYLDVDGNAITDISPLAAVPNLDHLSARGQSASIGPVARCVLGKVAVGTSLDGSILYGEPTIYMDHSGPHMPSGMMFGDQSFFLQSGSSSIALAATAPEHEFSITRIAPGDGGISYCEWPESFVPTLTVSGSGDVGTPLTSSVSWTGGPDVAPSVRYSYSEVATDLHPTVSPWWVYENPFTPVPGWDEGRQFTMHAEISMQGMATMYVSESAPTVRGVFPNLAVGYANPVVGGVSACVDLDTYLGSDEVAALHIGAVTAQYTWYLNDAYLKSTGDSPCLATVSTSYVGKTLRATVALSAPNYRDGQVTTPAATVLKAFSTDYRAGSISGARDVGSTLTVTPRSWPGVTVAYKYQWLRAGVAISGATSKTYTLTSADAGKRITVATTVSKTGYLTVTDVLATTVHSIFGTRPTPTISGTPTPGHTLTVVRGTWNPAPTGYAYQWYRNGKAVSGATKSTYKTKSTDGGAKFTVKVTATKSGYTTAAKTSASVTILKQFTKAPTPAITGTAKVKSTLSTKAGTWSPAATLTYQWYRNGKAISGATGKTYKPGVKDAYASFTVKVTGKKSGYSAVAKTSKAVTASGIKYANCTALKVDYPGGVAKASSTTNKVSGVSTEGIRSTTFVSAKLYALNPSLDRDKDGWACE